jgi:hypothetical protein
VSSANPTRGHCSDNVGTNVAISTVVGPIEKDDTRVVWIFETTPHFENNINQHFFTSKLTFFGKNML